MSELDEIRKRKLEELQQRQGEQNSQEMQAKQELAQIEAVVKQHMTKDALQRFGNIKSADHEKAMQLCIVIAQLLQQGRLATVDDAILKQILVQLAPKKRDFTITRK
jgi:programmed cell death protein 5